MYFIVKTTGRVDYRFIMAEFTFDCNEGIQGSVM